MSQKNDLALHHSLARSVQFPGNVHNTSYAGYPSYGGFYGRGFGQGYGYGGYGHGGYYGGLGGYYVAPRPV